MALAQQLTSDAGDAENREDEDGTIGEDKRKLGDDEDNDTDDDGDDDDDDDDDAECR